MPHYVMAIDVALGGADKWTASIVQIASGKIVQAVARGWSAKTPRLVVVAEIRALAKRYHISAIFADRVGRDLVKELLERDHGPTLIFTKATKSDCYVRLAPLAREGKLVLLDHKETISELASLVARPMDGGRLHVDAAHGRHDDWANSFALAVYHAQRINWRQEQAEAEDHDESWRPVGSGDSIGDPFQRPATLDGLDPAVREWATRHGHLGPNRCSEGDLKAAKEAYRTAFPGGRTDGRSDYDRMSDAGISREIRDRPFRRPTPSEEL